MKTTYITWIGIAALLFLASWGRVSEYSVSYLGFSLQAGANSSPVSFHVVTKFMDPAKPITAFSISKAEFKRVAAGFMESPANPKKENLFQKYRVNECGYFADTVIQGRFYKGGIQCSAVDELWRLRYGEYPFYGPGTGSNASVLDPTIAGPGWAQKPLYPSPGQVEFLKPYGIQTNIIDIIYGENAFRLLADMQNSEWVSDYRSR